jgi:hypothetical protein
LGKPSTQGVITRLAKNNCVKLGAKPKMGTMLARIIHEPSRQDFADPV